MNLDEFLNKYNISEDSFNETGLKWKDLQAIQSDFEVYSKELVPPAKYLLEKFHEAPKVHSVRYRIKNSEHLIEKIIRKKIKDPDREINIENYRSEITDLIGLRILHLFKRDWETIHSFIKDNWDLAEDVTAYYREGDSEEYIDSFTSLGCEKKEHPFGYRSVHYLLKTSPTKIEYIAEVQVRTIFEEAWSEIDHKVRYPHNIENNLLSQFLVILNRLAGSADEMGTYVNFLKDELQKIQEDHEAQLDEKMNKIKELKKQITEQIADSERDNVQGLLNDLEEVSLSKVNISEVFKNNPYFNNVIPSIFTRTTHNKNKDS